MPTGDLDVPGSSALLLADTAIGPRRLGCSLGGRLLSPGPDGIQSLSDVTLNDSDKTFTVAAAEIWRIYSIFVGIVTTATVGNRQIIVDVRDDADLIVARYQAAASITAGQTRTITYAHGVGGTTTGMGGNQIVSLATELWLPAAWDIRVYDAAAVDAAADDMTVGIAVRQVPT